MLFDKVTHANAAQLLYANCSERKNGYKNPSNKQKKESNLKPKKTSKNGMP